jgi:ABC-type lipoprotein export system ATPase subunit
MVANSLRADLPFSLLMMDDPTQSMDRPHKEYLADLISDLAKEKQIIIATSDIEFGSMLEAKMKGKMQKIELNSWTKDGPRMAASVV